MKYTWIFSALVAGGLAFWQANSTAPMFARPWGLLGAAFGVWLGLMFLLLRVHPLHAILKHPSPDPDEQIDDLERGINSFCAGSTELLAKARYRLMQLYKVRKRYEEAVAQGRAIVRMRGLTYVFESQLHLETAVCFDFLGREEEAEAERQAAADCLDERPENDLGWDVQGQMLDKEKRYDEAVHAYEKSLALTSSEHQEAREIRLMRLVLALYNAGHIERLCWRAEELLALNPTGKHALLAHRMAAIGHSNLGRLDESLTHRRKAHKLAIETGDPTHISNTLGGIAEAHRMRGEFDEAERVGQEAVAVAPKSAREALVILSLVSRNRGRLDEALDRLEQACRTGTLPIAHLEKRSLGNVRRVTAALKSKLGRHAEAWEDFRVAHEEMGSDATRGVLFEACRVRLLSFEAKRAEVTESAEAILKTIHAACGDSRTTRLDCLDYLGRALVEVGEYQLALKCWDRYLALRPYPVSMPVAWYYVGLCRLHLGDIPGAREALAEAASSGIDCQHTALAADKLRSREVTNPIS